MKTVGTKKYRSLLLALALLCVVALVGATATYKPVVSADQIVKPVMTDGASVRFMEDDKKDGIRFQMTLGKEEYTELKADKTFESGIILTSTSLLGENELTTESSGISIADTTDSWFIVYDNQEETEWHYASRAVVTDMGADNYGVNLSARGYIYTETLGYVYSDYSAAKNSRSMAYIAEEAIEEETDFDVLQALYKYVSTETLKDGYVCQTGDTVYTLPTFGEERPEYTVIGPKGAVEVINGNKVVLKDAGEYTATLGSNVITLKAYTAAAYEKVVAPLTSDQFEGEVYCNNKGKTEFDEDLKAYKFTQSAATDTIRIVKDSAPYNAIVNGADKYAYLAIDMYFETTPANVFFTVFKDVAKSRGFHTLATSGAYVYDGSTLRDAPGAGGLTTGKWYTIYLTVTEYSNSAFGGNGEIILLYMNGAGVYALKNIRYVDSLPGAAAAENQAQNGWIYTVGTELNLPLNEYGAGYDITDSKGAAVVTDASGAFTLTESGVYTATDGDATITFTAYTAAEYAKVLAPLTSTQFDAQFTAINYGTFTYDAEMNAYAFYQKDGNSKLRIVKDSEIYDKAKARESVTDDYIAVDMYFAGSAVPNVFWPMKSETGVSPQKFNTDFVYVDDGTQIKKNYGAGNMQSGRWYTVYFQATTMPVNAKTGDLELFYGNNYTGIIYLRNIHYVDALPTA